MAEVLNLGSHSMVVGYQEPLRLDPLDFPANSCASCARKWVQLRQTIALALWQGLDRRLRLAFEMKKKRLALGKGTLFFGNLRGKKHPKTYRCHPWWCNISPWIFWPPLAAFWCWRKRKTLRLNTFEAWWGTYINPGYMKLSNPRIAKAGCKARATEVCQCCLTGFLCRSHWGRRSRHTNLQKWDVLCLSFPSGWIGWQRFEMLYIILWAAWRWCADDVWQPMDEENMSTDSGKMSHPIKNQTIYQTRLTSTTAVASQQTRSNI